MTNFINEIKIFIVGKSLDYGEWISDNIVDTIEEADLVIFTGGEDITPMMYGEQQHITTEVNKNRDLREAVAYVKAISLNKPVLAICRGSQFVTVMNGGKLIQNVHNHAQSRGHMITDGEVSLRVTSTHHQMMFPFNLNEDDYKLIAWSRNRISDAYETGFGLYSKEQVPVEPEVVYYPKTNTLAVQYHPEYMKSDDPAVDYTKELICKYLFNGKINLPKKDDESIFGSITEMKHAYANENGVYNLMGAVHNVEQFQNEGMDGIVADLMAMERIGIVVDPPRPIIDWGIDPI